MLQTNKKDNKKIEYIALYCRVDSVNSQVNDLGIEAQKKHLALWAKQQGFSQEQIIYLVDSGFSGRTLDRPGIQQFLSGDRRYKIVAAVDFSRFSRNLALADELIDYADRLGTTLFAVKQNVSLNDWKRNRDQWLYALLKGGAEQ